MGHKVLQAMMLQRMNLNTWSTLHAVNKVTFITVKEDDFLDEQQSAAVTHFTMTQYSFKKALKIYPSVGKELKQLHRRNAFLSHKTPRPGRRKWPWNQSRW